MAQRSPTTEYRYARIDQIESVEGQEFVPIAGMGKNIVRLPIRCIPKQRKYTNENIHLDMQLQ